MHHKSANEERSATTETGVEPYVDLGSQAQLQSTSRDPGTKDLIPCELCRGALEGLALAEASLDTRHVCIRCSRRCRHGSRRHVDQGRHDGLCVSGHSKCATAGCCERPQDDSRTRGMCLRTANDARFSQSVVSAEGLHHPSGHVHVLHQTSLELVNGTAVKIHGCSACRRDAQPTRVDDVSAQMCPLAS